MALAAIEAYSLGEGRKRSGNQLETFGYAWGAKKNIDDQLIFYVSRTSVSISAKRRTESVEPHPNALKLKNNFMERWSPELSLLGHFHTHPYRDVDDVNSNKGYEFSDSDFRFLPSDDYLWERSENNPLMLAMTVCHLKRITTSTGEPIRNNVTSFSMGEFKFWLNASVGYLSSENRECTPNKRSSVFLDLQSRFFNMASDRLQDRG